MDSGSAARRFPALARMQSAYVHRDARHALERMALSIEQVRPCLPACPTHCLLVCARALWALGRRRRPPSLPLADPPLSPCVSLPYICGGCCWCAGAGRARKREGARGGAGRESAGGARVDVSREGSAGDALRGPAPATGSLAPPRALLCSLSLGLAAPLLLPRGLVLVHACCCPLLPAAARSRALKVGLCFRPRQRCRATSRRLPCTRRSARLHARWRKQRAIRPCIPTLRSRLLACAQRCMVCGACACVRVLACVCG